MITISPNVLGPATKETSFSASLSGIDGFPPYTFEVSSGALPPGLTLSSEGIVSGSPTTNGTYNFTIVATDSTGADGYQPYALKVTPPIYWYICTREEAPLAIPTRSANQDEQNRRIANTMGSVNRARHDIGDLQARPVLKDIRDHLLCDGSEVSRTGFPQLFEVIGTQWGEGDGSTTFNIPDLIGAALPVALSAPAQVITPTTVITPGTTTVVQPTQPSQTGGTTGGSITTGGRFERDITTNIE